MHRAFAAFAACGLSAAVVAAPAPQNVQAASLPGPDTRAQMGVKVDPWVLETAARGKTEFLVFLRDQADLTGADALPGRAEKGRHVYRALRAAADRSQAPVIAQIEALGLTYRPFWIANMIWVRGDSAAVQALALRADVSHIYANPGVRMVTPSPEGDTAARPGGTAGIEPGVSKVHAPDLWALGFTGQGVVVGGQDTGYDWNHAAIKNKYRGWNGATANHNYNWHDAIHSGGGVCGANSTQPCDDVNHGTHTMGTMVGDDGGTNQIGVAPGAKWIGCRNMNQGVGTPATYTECYQWFLAPTDLNDQNPDPSKSPDVINNSWGCPPSEGCIDPNVLLAVVDSVRAAGIVTVHSAGNSGSGCSSVSDPAAIYDSSFSVGATDINDNIASFSSRGPVTVDGSNRLKPDISAPGVNVRSSIPGGGYTSFSGTSMAGPHTVGVVALLMSASPALNGNPNGIESLLTGSAVPRTTTQTCGGVPGSSIPNNTYGYGRVDALNAYNALSPATMHIGDLDGRTQNNATKWAGEVTALVLNSSSQPVSGALVTFSVNGQSTRTCTTGATGTCFARVTTPDSILVQTWTVTGVTKSGTSYNPGANTDPDPDSNGTVIAVNQP